MEQAYIRKGKPGQQHGGEKEYGCRQLGGARTSRWSCMGFRLRWRRRERSMRVMRERRSAGNMLFDRPLCVIFRVGRGRSSGMARVRPGERNQGCDDGAEKRQENDRLVHTVLNPSSC